MKLFGVFDLRFYRDIDASCVDVGFYSLLNRIFFWVLREMRHEYGVWVLVCRVKKDYYENDYYVWFYVE